MELDGLSSHPVTYEAEDKHQLSENVSSAACMSHGMDVTTYIHTSTLMYSHTDTK